MLIMAWTRKKKPILDKFLIKQRLIVLGNILISNKLRAIEKCAMVSNLTSNL
jgi:hypothetical protein